MSQTTYIVAIHNATQTTHHFAQAAWLTTYQPTNEYTYIGVYTPPAPQTPQTNQIAAPTKRGGCNSCGKRK